MSPSQQKTSPHPRAYLSYSAMKMFEDNPEEFKRKYFYPETYVPHTNRAMGLGKEVAEALENDVETGDIEKDIVIAQFPKFERRDEKIMCSLSIGKGWNRSYIRIMVKPDSCTRNFNAFLEYKTGSAPWTQKKVDEDDQMTFYFAGLYLKMKELGGVMLPKGELVWAPTEKRVDEDGVERPHLLGTIKRFPTSRTFADILWMHARMSKCWREIGEAMENEII